ncbi:hypothetical protein [Hyalangium rubrum]|uniref:Lipoprotein n=1 Tax=Hyalangium rubrum TaxID=3103134 RepID=A0ABU5H3Y6_9BACT|nr:hypothetical protein [Hyalangium sp. s54d21]MDY7228182.1 hypothetical protein [Hyalangium sp. s54d21]
MHRLRSLTCLLALGAALTYLGCSDDSLPPVGPMPTPDAGTDGGTNPTPDAGTEVTDLVKDLILNQTNDTALPTTLDDKNLKDTQPPPAEAFPPSFFQ